MASHNSLHPRTDGSGETDAATLPVETFDTNPVEASARISYWNAAARSVFDAIEVEPGAGTFAGRLSRRHYGSVQLATVDSTPVEIRGLAGSKLHGIYLLINERGTCHMQQRGRTSFLRTGELTVLCSHEPYRLQCARPHRTHVLYVPDDDLDQVLDDHIAAAHPPAESDLLAAFIARLAGLPSRRQPRDRVLDTTLSLIRLTWPGAARFRTRLDAPAWRERLHRYVERRFDDPDLNAGRVAAHFGISRRYVQKVFAESGTTLSRILLERRLNAVADRLRGEPTRPISDIALEAGFNDVSHFCRRFRARFGVTAREYRRCRRADA